MRNIEEIVINRVALSILDRENDKVIFPTNELELTEDAYDYFEKHILKGMRDEDAKAASFEGDSSLVRNLCYEIFDDASVFLDNSKKLAHYLYKCMKNDEKEVSGDLAVCLFESQAGKYIGILKLNFSDIYCHFLKEGDNGVDVGVGISKTGLPNMANKIARCAFIREKNDGNAYDLLLCDRELEGYFVQAFLKCSLVRDSRENTKIIRKASEQFVRKAFKDNAHEAENFRNKLTDSLKNEDRFNIERIADQSFSDSTIRNEYKAALLGEGISENEVTIDREWAEKKLQRKRLKVDKSIELYIDTEAYNDKEKFQIKRNGDGTIDIILKNIKNYIEK